MLQDPLHRGVSDIFADTPNRFFETCAGIPEDVICAWATHGLKGIKWCNINTANRADKKFQLIYEGHKFRDQFDIDLANGTLGPGKMLSECGDRGTGRTMYANRILVAMALGLKSMRAQAGELMGAYVWSKAGVYPNEDELPDLRNALQARLEVLQPYLSALDYAYVQDVCALRTPQGITAIADLAQVITPDIPDFNRALRLTNDFYKYDEYASRGLLGRDMSVAQFLLCGLSYNGSIAFDNPAQMDRAESYCRKPVRRIFADFIQPTQSARCSSSQPYQTAHPL
jgi:hypothetical protein